MASKITANAAPATPELLLDQAPGPLVEPADGLSPAEVERYSRHLIIPEIGSLGQRRLKNAKVLVIGAGGLGSPALLYLAAAGVGTLGIVDDDDVDLSNLQRQVIHGVADVGRPKIESARDAIAALNPLVDVRLHNVRLDASNALDLFAGYDLILDGADNFATRYLVNDAAAILGKPYVWGSIFRFDGQVSVFWEQHGPTYRDLYPEAPPAGSVPSCGEGGVFGMLCAAVGSLMVTEAVKLITGVGRSLLGRVALFDALGGSWREIKVSRDPEAGRDHGAHRLRGLLRDHPVRRCGHRAHRHRHAARHHAGLPQGRAEGLPARGCARERGVRDRPDRRGRADPAGPDPGRGSLERSCRRTWTSCSTARAAPAPPRSSPPHAPPATSASATSTAGSSPGCGTWNQGNRCTDQQVHRPAGD